MSLSDKELLKEIGEYLKRNGWYYYLIEEEGILMGDTNKKKSFRISFKFIGGRNE